MRVAIDYKLPATDHYPAEERTSVGEGLSTAEVLLHFYVIPDDFGIPSGEQAEIIDVRIIGDAE